jgi:hypothetical protein
MKLNQTTWEALALLPWMVIFSAVVIGLSLGLPSIADLSLLGLIIYVLLAVAVLVAWIVFIVHAWRSGRTGWAISIFILSIFACPVYWWKFVRTPPSQGYESSTSLDKENVKPFLEK